MKRLLLIAALFASLSLDAQFVTTLAKNASESQSDGIMYYLPKNVVRLEFTIEETEYCIGPYAEYSSKLLGVNDYIKENKSEFNIKSVDIQTVSEIDPNAMYFISTDDKGKEPMPNIILDTDGLILALGYDNLPSNYIARNTFNDSDLEQTERVEATFVEILDNEVEIDDEDEDEDEDGGNGKRVKEITKEDRAKAALEKISNIRTAYFELISGAQEVAFGATTKYMAKTLQELEYEYVSLFKGKAVKNIYKKVIYITPEKNQSNIAVSVGKGQNVKVQFDSHNALGNMNPTNDDVKNSAQVGKLFYRMPANTTVKVLSGNTVIAEKALNISQFGDIRVVTVKGNKALFNPNTGQIISITK